MRDRLHMLRMYGDRVDAEPGWGLAAWAGLLLLAAVLSFGLSLASFVGAQTPDATQSQLVRWGVLHESENWVAAVPDDDAGDAGCVLTGEAVVRWDGQKPTGRILLRSVPEVELRGERVHLHTSERTIECAARSEGGLAFEAILNNRINRLRQDWRPGPDPRVAHLFAE